MRKIETGDDVRAAREAMGLSQRQLAERLRLGGPSGWQSVSAWERGARIVPGPVAVAMELMLAAAG